MLAGAAVLTTPMAASAADTEVAGSFYASGSEQGDIALLSPAAQTYTIPYYDAFGDKTDVEFVFTDGSQTLGGTELFAEGSDNKSYSLEYDDPDNGIDNYKILLTKGDSAYTKLMDWWNSDTSLSGKTIDSAKMSLHRYFRHFYCSDYNSNRDHLTSSDIWQLYMNKKTLVTGDKVKETVELLNDNGSIECDYGTYAFVLEGDEVEPNKRISDPGYKKCKEITKTPVDIYDYKTPDEFYRYGWRVWSARDKSGGEYEISAEPMVSDYQYGDLAFDDLNSLANINSWDDYILLDCKQSPIVYTVNVEGGTALDVTVENKSYPADGGDYMFIYGDSVSKIVKNGDELWTEIEALSADYDSSRAKLIKITDIPAVALTVDAPAIGAVPADVATGSALYTVSETLWNPTSAKFAAYTAYTVTAIVTPSQYARFSGTITATVNSEPATVKPNADGTLEVTYTFMPVSKNSITSIDVTVTAPEEGKTPDNTSEVPANANYTVKSVSWDTDKAFTTGVKYTVTTVLEPDEAYVFSEGITAKVNGNSAEAKLAADGSLTVTYAFDKLKDDIDRELEKEHPVIKIPDGTPIPADVIKRILDGDKEVEIDFDDDDYSWIIIPDPEHEDIIEPVNLNVKKVDEKNWATVVNNVTGHRYRMQIEIAHDGEFGFTAYLVIDLSEGMANAPDGTYYANLYQVKNDKLEWNGYSDLVNENGKWIAKLKFTHSSEWLITIDTEINPSSDNGGDSGSTSTRPSTGSTFRYATTMKSVGWDKITDEIKKSETGSTIDVTLNDETTMPADALQAAIDRGTKLIMDAGFGRTWTVDGKKAVPGKAIDLSISGVNVGIPEAAYADIICSDSRQLKLNARLLNFTAQLTAFIGKDNIGQNAALYSYNEETGKLVFQDISVVDRDGNVIFDIKCGGRYFIALGSEVTAPYYLCGDVNGDGVVNALDASAILKNAVYGYPLDKRCGDTNADGEVNAHDALPILHYVVGDVKILPVADSKFSN